MSDKVAIQCPTEELWDKVKKEMNKRNGTYWDPEYNRCVVGKNTCIVEEACDNSPGYGSQPHWERQGYTIISASEYLGENEFQVGDRVEFLGMDSLGCYTEWADRDRLRIGQEYVIKNRSADSIKLKNTPKMFWHKECFFKSINNQSNQTKTTKEETMKKAIEDNFEKTKDANLVEAELPGSKLTEFVNDHLVKIYSKEILAEAKRLKKERQEA